MVGKYTDSEDGPHVLLGVDEKGAYLDEGFHILERVLDLCLVAVSLQDILSTHGVASTTFGYMVRDENAQTVEEFCLSQNGLLSLEFNLETGNRPVGASGGTVLYGDWLEHGFLEEPAQLQLLQFTCDIIACGLGITIPLSLA